MYPIPTREQAATQAGNAAIVTPVYPIPAREQAGRIGRAAANRQVNIVAGAARKIFRPGDACVRQVIGQLTTQRRNTDFR